MRTSALLLLLPTALAASSATATEVVHRGFFTTRESPDAALRVINQVTVRDGSVMGVLPPMVDARKTDSHTFRAEGPFGTDVQARYTQVEPDRNGGSIVYHETRTRSPIPFMAEGADLVHGVFTDPQLGFERAESRIRGWR